MTWACVTGIYDRTLTAEANAPQKVVGSFSSIKLALAEAWTASSSQSRRVWVHATRSVSDAVLTYSFKRGAIVGLGETNYEDLAVLSGVCSMSLL